jgi:type II secretory pathway pseudopilin PulG
MTSSAPTPLGGRLRPVRAITLVEMLVSIFIVSLLAALCFPAFSKFSKAGTVTKCLNNQRQITTAYLAYLADADGALWFRPSSGSDPSGWSGGSGAIYGPQSYPAAAGYFCTLLAPYGLQPATWTGFGNPIGNRSQTVWYCPATYNKQEIAGHGATYFYQYLGTYAGLGSGAKLAAVSDHISSKPYLRDYFGNHEDPKKLFPTTRNVYTYLDGHSEYR